MLIVAYMIPVVWLSVKHTGFPIPQVVYGKVLEKVTAREAELIKDPEEIEVRNIFKERAAEANALLKGLPASFDTAKANLTKKVDKVKASGAEADKIAAAPKTLDAFPKSADEAKAAWTRQAGQAARSN